VLGRSLLTEAEHVAAARAMVESGVRVVYLSRGAAGGILARDHDLLIAAPPPVEARSPVGAGDAALAGLLWSIAEEVDAERMARRCVACGTAAAMQEGTGVGDAALVEELIPKVTVRAAFQAGRSSAVWS
jgi:fructose-1-phosphate kinase PfkB-like protein